MKGRPSLHRFQTDPNVSHRCRLCGRIKREHPDAGVERASAPREPAPPAPSEDGGA